VHDALWMARLDKTYHAFFRRVQNGEKPGFPRFQGRTRYHSFTDKEYGNGARLEHGSLVLSTIGRIAVRWSRPVEGAIKTVTVSKEADGWYVCCSCAHVPTQPLPLTGNETGIDVGLTVFLITADGEMVENPRHDRTAEKRLATAHRRVSRRKKGSKRRKKAARLCAKRHQHVQRQRRDVHHKTALAVLRTYDTISLEDVRVANMVRNKRLAKPISDAGWAQFRTILECKAVYAGRRVVAVPPASTSQEWQWLWGARAQALERAHARLPDLRAGDGPRRERGQEYSMARTAPAETRGDACGDEPRTRRAFARAACQSEVIGHVHGGQAHAPVEASHTHDRRKRRQQNARIE
jgi:IS605 OrfB family transposase